MLMALLKVAKSFICRGCLNPVTSAVRTSVDIGASAKLELVDKFCYLDDMMSVDGDADAAVEARIRIGWNKFRHCLPIRTHTHTHTRLTALFPGLPGWAGTRKVKPIWIY